MFDQKSILISLTIFIIISFSFLAILEKKQHQIKDNWFLYFENIEDASPNFTIENYSKTGNFTWEIFINDSKVKEDSAQVLNNNKKNVSIDKPLGVKSIKIVVSYSKDKKEIYKNLE
ncbi:MAG: hypothetical protein UR66_C0003G0041 [Candidatus Moranbacteria bacterium GW2011_GWE1_35_17]|nr:MAG: hypothetical protein UR66_C0003G0041 [Candidatus Moranbacteria bacterium GW2011_GWE1_35_17]KKP71966.1 MAG: hypothetical protein UR65_C0022G0005 [Candidatus Moranbacteria bacterium GW2011_GWE2_35_164]KKP82864.1 MAG: hypothetical protein UR83_C0043G0006 [Candidatus Moranbacteria bacterium GW2011_GWF2_35_54]KKP84188.1 MAG: hypothetical protein UR82_C0010G0006 [Candidatus Moranbacteria bacterium GW2011_GWF1_35_5]